MALNSTAACTLGLLDIGPPPPDRVRWEADGTMSGSEAWSAIERSVGGFWTVTRSQVYQELKKLVGDGLAGERSSGRYFITAAGAEAARSWFEAFALAEPRDDQLRSPLTLTVFFGHYLPTELLARVVREHRLRLERRLDALRHIEASLHEDRSLPGVTLQRALGDVGGAIDWTDDVLERINAADVATDSGRTRD